MNFIISAAFIHFSFSFGARVDETTAPFFKIVAAKQDYKLHISVDDIPPSIDTDTLFFYTHQMSGKFGSFKEDQKKEAPSETISTQHVLVHLTNAPDSLDLANSIRRNCIYEFYTKPWDGGYLVTRTFEDHKKKAEKYNALADLLVWLYRFLKTAVVIGMILVIAVGITVALIFCIKKNEVEPPV